SAAGLIAASRKDGGNGRERKATERNRKEQRGKERREEERKVKETAERVCVMRSGDLAGGQSVQSKVCLSLRNCAPRGFRNVEDNLMSTP
ncbi:hypothetical protein CRUP_008974, partial [Coryphaenoides rupestris]